MNARLPLLCLFVTFSGCWAQRSQRVWENSAAPAATAPKAAAQPAAPAGSEAPAATTGAAGASSATPAPKEPELAARLAMPAVPPVAAEDDADGIDRRRGREFLSVRTHYGTPIFGKSLFWDGNGQVNNNGLGVHWGRFIDDGVALGLGTTGAAWWKGGSNVYSAEVEGLVRIYPWLQSPVFFDATGGFQLANHQIPPGGTLWNFSFSFGTGVEIPVAKATGLQIGAMYHHISNALGRESSRNPSQNELRLWLGLVFEF